MVVEQVLLGIGSLWLIFLFFVIIFWRCFKTKSNALEQYYDQCNESTAYHNYLIKLCFGSPRNGYNLARHTVQVDVLNSRNRHLARFIVNPHIILEKSRPIYQDHESRMVSFQLNRSIPLSDIGSVRLSHDCYGGQLYVNTLEIQDLKTKEYYISNINSFIGMIAPHMKSGRQVYTCVARGPVPIDCQDVPPSAIISWSESLQVGFFVANFLLLLSLYSVYCCDYFLCFTYRSKPITNNQVVVPTDSAIQITSNSITTTTIVNTSPQPKINIVSYFYTGLINGILMITLTGLLFSLYTYVKYNYSRYAGSGFFNILRHIFRLILIGGGIGFSILTIVLCEDRLDNDSVSAWVINSATSFGLFIILGCPMIIFCVHMCQCTREVNLRFEPILLKRDNKNRPLTKVIDEPISFGSFSSPLLGRDKTPSRESIKSTGSKYYEAIAGKVQVKSVSQYRALAEQQQLIAPVSPTLDSSTPVTPTRQKSHISTGSEYYNALVQEGKAKVKSVSQYMGKKV